MVVPPTLTLGASTNYNQNSAVLNATVTATGNRAITSVEFQWSNSPTFTAGAGITISDWTAAATNTVINQGTTGTARTLNATGLSNGTPYYVRFRATNASGFVTTSAIGGGFTTYSLRTETFTGSRTWTNPRTSSGSSGLAITEILNLDCRAGGGGQLGGYITSSWPGGGGARTTASSASVGSSVVVTVGGGGGEQADGGATTIGSLLSAAGGKAPELVSGEFFSFYQSGSSGNGFSGGTTLGGLFSGPQATGGGGGAGGVGGNAYLSTPGDPNSAPVAGNAGPGWTTGYGEGGKGSDENFNTTPLNGGVNTGNGAKGGKSTINPDGSSTGYPNVSGGSGYAQFQYWGP